MREFGPFLPMALLALVLGCAAPETQTVDAPPNRAASSFGIDGPALLHHVQVLSADSMEGRAIGTPGNARARRYVASQFESIGLEALDGGYERPFPLAGNDAGGVNLVGELPGTAERGTYLVISAHYDHLGIRNGEIYHGADDNASGTAGLLALAAWFAQHPPRHSILFAALDGEEGGLQGARAFVADPPVPRDRIALDVNLDMVSNSDSLLFAAGTHHYPFLASYVDAVVPQPGVVLRLGHDLPGTGSDDWTDASDHGPFHGAGIPFLYFGVEDHAFYHRPGDTFETINPAFFVGAVATIGEIITRLDEALEGLMEASGRRP